MSRNDATDTTRSPQARACCATGQDAAVKENGAAIDNVFGFRWPLRSPSRFALLWTTKVTSFHSCVSFSFVIPLQTTTSRASTKLKCVSIQFPNLSLSLPPPRPHPPHTFHTSTRIIFLSGTSAHDCSIHRSHSRCKTAWLSIHCGRRKEGGQCAL